MSDFCDLENVLKKKSRKIFRRLYFKRRQAGGYETDWQLVPDDRVVSYGQITYAWDKPSVWQISAEIGRAHV